MVLVRRSYGPDLRPSGWNISGACHRLQPRWWRSASCSGPRQPLAVCRPVSVSRGDGSLFLCTTSRRSCHGDGLHIPDVLVPGREAGVPSHHLSRGVGSSASCASPDLRRRDAPSPCACRRLCRGVGSSCPHLLTGVLVSGGREDDASRYSHRLSRGDLPPLGPSRSRVGAMSFPSSSLVVARMMILSSPSVALRSAR